MRCKKCGTDNPDYRKCCINCYAFLEGWTINNVTGDFGYRGGNGFFYKSKEAYLERIKKQGGRV